MTSTEMEAAEARVAELKKQLAEAEAAVVTLKAAEEAEAKAAAAARAAAARAAVAARDLAQPVEQPATSSGSSLSRLAQLERGDSQNSAGDGTPPRKPRRFGAPSPKEIMADIAANDPSVTKVDFTGNASFQVKADEYCELLRDAMMGNTFVKELKLANCDIKCRGAAALGELLAANHTLQVFDLEKNNIREAGGVALAGGLAKNTSVRVVNLLSQQQPPGDAVCVAFVELFDTNVTLLKVTWRVNSRKSFAMSDRLTRNNEINRRLKSGRDDFEDLLPESMRGEACPRLAPYDL